LGVNHDDGVAIASDAADERTREIVECGADIFAGAGSAAPLRREILIDEDP
jgi:hypothetical protein